MLELRQVSIQYGKRQAVSEVRLQVQAGEIVTLVGGNGAGKTTTLKAISGLLPLSGGESLALQRHDGTGAPATWQPAFTARSARIARQLATNV